MAKAWIAATSLPFLLLLAACEDGGGASSKTPISTPGLATAAETPAATAGPPPERPASFDAYADTIATYLGEQPGAAACPQELLAAWAMPLIATEDACLSGNTDDDADDELVMAISARLDPGTATSDTGYRIAVLDPSDGGYVVAFQTASYEAVPLGTPVLKPLLAVGDLNGDGGGEFAYQTMFCGPEGCLATAFVYKGTAGDYDTVSPRDGISIGEGTFSISDSDGDGTMEVLATGGGRGTAESGPERPRTEVWAWDGAFYALSTTLPADSPYLYHRVVDADAALEGGDFAAAEAAYIAAVENPLAQAWRIDTNELAELRAYALFRAALAHLMSGGDADTAAGYLDSAKALRNTLHAQLAASFQAGYSAKGEVGVGCAAVQDDLRANDAEYAAFWNFGTDNPPYNPAGICPF
ncbi:MAG TPA: hypothetical protein VJP07_07850 [Dehalococcoidia bacterium]|nr:hypothetical protein [Dehalococcoidia bacterium]